MKYLKRILLVILIIVLVATLWIVYRVNDHPSLTAYADRTLAAAAADGPGLRVTFLGTSTLLFDDGETAIITDGFFTRPGKLRLLFTRLEPDHDLIARYLQRAGVRLQLAGVRHLAANIVVHSHFDHALDAPVVARQTGALLIGSQSTANVGRGSGLSNDQIRIVPEGEAMSFGRFQITLLRSQHIPQGFALGEITEPLQPPARAWAYKEGGSYSVLIEHSGKAMLVQGSAGFLEGALTGRRADVVFLGIGQLGRKDDDYRERLWNEVVSKVAARRVIPIHWDDFSLPLDQPLVPMPRLFDDFDKSMSFLVERGSQTGVDVKILPAWVKVDPFAGL